MNKNFASFAAQKNRNFFIASTNLFMFMPHFFSVGPLFKTLFSPWKNLKTGKTTAGFSFEEWWNRFTFNVISRFVGAGMRGAIIGTYLLLQVVFVLCLPFAFIIYNLISPLLFAFQGTDSETQKQKAREEFIKNHSLNQSSQTAVSTWYDSLNSNISNKPWYDLSRLLSTPPIGRDWAAGYTPTLDQFATEIAKESNTVKKLIGRDSEITHIEQVLTKSNEANVVLVGEDGVGRHSVVQALADRMYAGTCNPVLVYKRIMKVDMEKVLAQSPDYVTREQIMKDLLKEAATAGNIVIFIDDIDKYVSSDEDRVDLSTVLEEYASGSKIQFIGVTTPFFYQKYIFKNEKIASLFEKIEVAEVNASQAVPILLSIVPNFESRFKITIPYESVSECISKSDYYITTAPFPEKAIDLLDEVCSYTVNNKLPAVTPEIINQIIETKTHVPINIDDSLKQKLVNLETTLKKVIIAQDEAVNKLSGAIRKSFVIGKTRKKPLASFLFLGPTGVGKTETAKAVATVFFDSSDKMIRFDMSLYQSKDNIPQLIGSATTNDPGLLAKAIREKPYGVLLLDEIEKADHDLLNIFLTLLDEGYFTDGFGKRVDCRNLMVIATSNAGGDFIYEGNTTSLIDHLVEEHIFNPEFLNRFDDVITYKALNGESITILATRMLNSIKSDIESKQGVHITVTPTFITNLVEKGYNVKFGARNMARIIRDEVENKIAAQILDGSIKKGGTISF
ncbi:hypothetical protein A3D80_02450 [Candidatus Roizmanbacteria bacterium RIFCSPHIGHO2_02_FULL_40_13b]|uniref:AAA+ ATPase domain-containing protein n=1 Tax=Candidatus Roizmanbacteria bacterium RIFCSPHIGHO2_01_FULL_39_24 TaxID=1802032 RepID=A0A1F7GJI9_9BACT|nr:MAG: hypothetical protein A2799_01940 [Candidatus Roizmanbacteria bacterium RIFCSPHIGHO2_01_FULL_39_24]OGK26501.1 MAG: hypothetical protein A3D80_02450 [Candidatus Roizmanbacteria bacterium RIFCSPHIGHO2_02_FULL_40_13b]OGK50351.1 MAG: hypothetical protein A3A56_00215 [Candidatus Roizmanbacteria bacterium RIFCSPLOWO2_01_FULL_40_32]